MFRKSVLFAVLFSLIAFKVVQAEDNLYSESNIDNTMLQVEAVKNEEIINQVEEAQTIQLKEVEQIEVKPTKTKINQVGTGFFVGAGYSARTYEYQSQGFAKRPIGIEQIEPISGISETLVKSENGFLQFGYKTQNLGNTPIFTSINITNNIDSASDIYLEKHYQTGNLIFQNLITKEDFKISITPIIETSISLGLRFDNLSIYGVLGAVLYKEKIKTTFSVHQHNHVNKDEYSINLLFGAGVEFQVIKNLFIFGEFTIEKINNNYQFYHYSLLFEEVGAKDIKNIKVGTRFYFN